MCIILNYQLLINVQRIHLVSFYKYDRLACLPDWLRQNRKTPLTVARSFLSRYSKIPCFLFYLPKDMQQEELDQEWAADAIDVFSICPQVGRLFVLWWIAVVVHRTAEPWYILPNYTAGVAFLLFSAEPEALTDSKWPLLPPNTQIQMYVYFKSA